jgi:quercetin dioxygenase-like cupin family protein
MEHYAWNTVPGEQLNPRLHRRTVHVARMTIARLELRKEARVPEHSHPHEQVTMVERGALKFSIGGEERTVRAGEILAIAPGEPHSVEALEDSTVVDLFSPVREDWIRGDDSYLRR